MNATGTASQNVTNPPVARAARRPWIKFAVVVAIASVASFTIAWYGGLRNRFIPVNFGIVEPGRLYRSGQISQHVIRKTLQDNHIGLIIDLSSKWENTPNARAEKQAANELGVRRLVLTLRGNGVGDPDVYPKALREIMQANRDGKGVLVHCQSGSERTGGVIAAYRILVEKKNADEAFDEARRYGFNSRRNAKLIPFVEEHLPEWSEKLAAPDTRPASPPNVAVAP